MKHTKGLQKTPSQELSFFHDEIDLTNPTLKVTFENLVVAIFFLHVSLAGEQLHHMPSHLRRRFHPFFAAESNLGAMESWEVSPQVLTWTVLGSDIFGDSVFPCLFEALSFRDLQTHVVVD